MFFENTKLKKYITSNHIHADQLQPAGAIKLECDSITNTVHEKTYYRMD